MKKILLILLVALSFASSGQIIKRKGFGLDLNATPPLTRRIIIGEVGALSENMTMQQLSDFVTTNLDVYTTTEIDGFFTNYLSKTNLSAYTPTLDTHPATKKYADEANKGQISGDSGTTLLGNGRILHWFKFLSTEFGPQYIPFPFPFTTACINVTFSPGYSNVDLILTKDGFTYDKDNSVADNQTVYVQAIGY